jgi:hypothetical protein
MTSSSWVTGGAMAGRSQRPGGPSGIVEMLEQQFHVPTTPAIGRGEAAQRIYQEVAGGPTSSASLTLSDQPVMRGALFDAAGERVSFPEGTAYERCYVGLLDPAPTARWAHQAWWAFVPAGGEGPVVLRETQLPENSSGAVRMFPPEQAR